MLLIKRDRYERQYAYSSVGTFLSRIYSQEVSVLLPGVNELNGSF